MYPTIATIKAKVCEHFEVRPIEMVSHRRSRCVARPRQIAMVLARDLTPHSYPAIGREFGGRDHTTVMHAVAVVERLCREDAAFRATYEGLRTQLYEQAAA